MKEKMHFGLSLDRTARFQLQPVLNFTIWRHFACQRGSKPDHSCVCSCYYDKLCTKLYWNTDCAFACGYRPQTMRCSNSSSEMNEGIPDEEKAIVSSNHLEFLVCW